MTMIARRRLLASASVFAAGLAPALLRAQQPELAVGIVPTESQSAARPRWMPFLADMERAIAMKVVPYFASDYAGIIEAMRFNRVQLAWLGNASAIPAVDRASGEVFAQATNTTGGDGRGYYSVLIVHRDSQITSFADVTGNPGRFTFGNGDPNSTSGFLTPSYYAWALNNIDIRRHFSRVVSGSHEANMLAVANRQVDVAATSTEDLDRLERASPERRALIRVIWRSPLIPSDPIVWRHDLADDLKQRVRTFFLAYGVPETGKPESEVARELAVLRELRTRPFRASSNRQLLPIREVLLFRDRLRVENDERLSAEQRATQLREIDQRLAELRREMGS